MYSTKSHRAPGSGSVSKNPSGTYRAQITIPSRKGNRARRVTHSFNTKREAEEWLRGRIKEIDTGLTAENRDLTLGEYHEQWLSAKQIKVRSGTYDDYARLCRLYIVPRFGEATLRTVKTADVNAFYVSLTKRGVGVPTIDYVHRVLRTIFSDAIRAGIIGSNPCRYADRPKGDKSRNVEAMSENEVSAFLELANQTPFGALFRTAVMTGMRLGELLGLTWRDIDFLKGTIRVNKQIPSRKVKGVPRETTAPKTKSGNRTLPVSQNLLDVLQRHFDTQRKRALLKGSAWKDHSLVFSSNVGTPLQPGDPEKSCKKIFAEIGLNDSFTFHNLRHTAASIMLSNGMSLVEVSKYLGHSSPVVTAQIYAHLLQGGLEKAAAVFDQIVCDNL